MLTPQEVEERVFPKAKKAGYDMQDVDNFLDQLTADYTELYKENAVLKRKMKVLADKITEYQETEGAMRATLLAAQKMADQLVDEAKTKREKMLSDAETIVKSQLGKLSERVAEEEAKLRKAQASVAAMTASSRVQHSAPTTAPMITGRRNRFTIAELSSLCDFIPFPLRRILTSS